ncbi:MAG: serine/threonine protein kinase [Deltaproteobacteria bacterium]|nr:serine/threonine protein kinase [Deltaproteobacteria bacterium]
MRHQDVDRPELEPGTFLDRYELLSVVARGGMGSVWLARLAGKHGFEKLVAVKTILPYYAADPLFRSMLLDEARIASGIVHPNVAQTIDLGEQDDVLYTVMEWMEGDSLRALLRRFEESGSTLPLGISLRVVADACAGLHAAHEVLGPDGSPAGIVHRDVSPHNILITSGGVSKLIDFGIAKARGRVAEETSPGNIKGKIGYMAPEQAIGAEVDRRADIWGLGATLYHAVAGKPAYGGENQAIALHKLLSHTPAPALDDSVPAPVRAIIAKAMAPEVEARFPTAADMGRAIDDAMRQTRLAPSHADVAAFYAEHMGDAIRKRQRAIEQGLRSAAKRHARDQQSAEESNASVADPSSSVIASSVTVDSENRNRVVFALGIAVFVAIGLIGVIGFRFGSRAREPSASTSPASASAATAATSAPAVAPSLPPSESAPLQSALPATSSGPSAAPVGSRPPRRGPSKPGPRTSKGSDQDVDDGF